MAAEASPTLSAAARATEVKAKARELGFTDAGITDLTPTPHGDALERWIAAGHAGVMRYMHRQAARRKNPGTILDGAKVAVVVSYNYGQSDAPPIPGSGRVARYARGADYHDALRPALDQLAEFIRALGGADSVARPFIDAGPVPERELAQRAGLGWIGKNTMLIDPGRGSYSLLASVLTNVALSTDPPFAADRCGSCRRCLDACPTNAFPEPRVLDATRCISYVTIESRGEIPPGLAPLMGDWIFGCDVCQEVCPWNGKFAGDAEDGILRLDPSRAWISLDAFTALNDAEFVARYGWTPLARPGLDGMRRNAAVAATNAPSTERP